MCYNSFTALSATTAPWPSFSMPTPCSPTPVSLPLMSSPPVAVHGPHCAHSVSPLCEPVLHFLFCSVHLHNKLAKKHNCHTDLLTRLYIRMLTFDVDFIADDLRSVRMTTSLVLLATDHQGALMGLTRDMQIAWASSECPYVHLTGSCAGMTASRSPINDSTLMRAIRALIARSTCTSSPQSF